MVGGIVQSVAVLIVLAIHGASANLFVPSIVSSSGTTKPFRRGSKHLDGTSRFRNAAPGGSKKKKGLTPWLPRSLGKTQGAVGAAARAGKTIVVDDYQTMKEQLGGKLSGERANEQGAFWEGGLEAPSSRERAFNDRAKSKRKPDRRTEQTPSDQASVERAWRQRERAIQERLADRLTDPRRRTHGRTRWGQFGSRHGKHSSTSISPINSHLQWHGKGDEGGINAATTELVRSKEFRKASKHGPGDHHSYTPTHVRAGLHPNPIASTTRPAKWVPTVDGGGSRTGEDPWHEQPFHRARAGRANLFQQQKEDRAEMVEKLRERTRPAEYSGGSGDGFFDAVSPSPGSCGGAGGGGRCGASPPGRAKGDRVAERVMEGLRVSAACVQSVWIWKNTQVLKDTHMATLAEVGGGGLLAAWQAAPGNEGDSSQTIMTALSHDGGVTWGGHRKVSEFAGMYRGALWGPALFNPLGQRSEGRRTHMFFSGSNYCALSARGKSFRPGGDVLVTTTADGEKWTKPKVILRQRSAREIPYVTANGPAVARDGTWALPVWGEFPPKTLCNCTKENEAAFALVSSDQGRRWRKSAPLKGKGTWLIEGTVIPLSDGRLLQLFRTRLGSLYRSVSANQGRTWSEAQPTDLPNPNSKVHAIVLSNGEIALAYNHHKSRANIDGVRSRLYVATSADEGASWDVIARLETDTTKGHRYHYPWLLQQGCDLLVAYTVRFRGYSLYGPKGETAGIKLATLRLEGGRQK